MNNLRWSNITAARHAYETGGEIAGRGPIEAFFEVAARCNLHCQMCAINYDSRYKPRSGRPPFFEPDLFARLRPIFPSLLRAYLFGLGEPTLNKHLVDYIAELSDAGAEVWFNTNATLIDTAMAEAIARAGADKITVSIDGATAATYETIRQGAKFDHVIRGIRALVNAGIAVNLSFVAMASNIDELPAMVDLCADLGATGVHVEPLFAQPTSADLMDHYSREHLGRATNVAGIFDEASQRAADHGVTLASRFMGERNEFDYLRRVREDRIDWTCSEPWSSIWVTSAGEVRTCCINETSFGDLYQQSIDEIWNGSEYRAFRSQHARREAAKGCGNCVANGRVRQSPFFKTIEAVTYRPVILPATLDDSRTFIDAPAEGAAISDPLIVHGATGMPIDLELMIDHTCVYALHATGRFAIEAPIPFVTEGAHLVWMRPRGEQRGWPAREVFLWRSTPASASPLRLAPESERPAAPSRL
ncbi:MAG TPA: radical SAM protein [Thermoanaerobaculia bacterium]|nr:radical SAM protein [Thermoanaerobaculia bacterium]